MFMELMGVIDAEVMGSNVFIMFPTVEGKSGTLVRYLPEL